MKQVILYLPLWQHEVFEEIQGPLLKAISDSYSETVKIHNAQKTGQLKHESDALIVTDSVHRFSDDANKAIRVILDLLSKNNEVWIPDSQLDLRRDPKTGEIRAVIDIVSFLTLFSEIKAKAKSSRIRASLHTKKILDGKIHNSSKVSPEFKKTVVEEFKRSGRIRETSRILNTSPATVSRIIKEWKNEQ